MEHDYNADECHCDECERVEMYASQISEALDKIIPMRGPWILAVESVTQETGERGLFLLSDGGEPWERLGMARLLSAQIEDDAGLL